MTNESIPETDPLEEEFASLLGDYLPEATPKQEGELVDATVVAVLDDAVLVSYGSKEETPIALTEFLDPQGQPTVKPGDSVRVLLTGWSGQGVPELSYAKARAAAAAKMLEEALEAKVPVRGTISRVIKGGVLVDVGMPAFMPASHVDLFRINDLDSMIGREIEAYVIEFNEKRGRAVLSRRQLLQERRDKGRVEFLENVKAGDTLKGTVRDVLDFGAFVSFGDAEGLIPRSELSYERGTHPSEIVKEGEEIEVKVLDVSAESGKITLSRKRVNVDPWENITANYSVGSTVNGRIVKVEKFGAFVNLQEGLTGMIHANDISWESEQKSPQEHFREGDHVTCQIVEIDTDRRRLGLSLKHLARDPWTDIEEKFPVGSRHKGKVTGLRNFGAFVKLDDYAEGLVHISDMSWTRRLNHPSEMLEEDQEVEVAVLKLDRAQRQIGLGIKQVEGSPLDNFIADHPKGSIVTGKVTRFAPFGAFVELTEGLDGLVHISEIAQERVESPEKALKIGEEIQVKILEIDGKRNRVSLSRRKAIEQAERENIRQYTEKSNTPVGGGLFADALQAASKKQGKQ